MRTTSIWITVFFFADGLLVGSWAARIPAVQDNAGLTASELGFALFAMALGALLAMPLAGAVGEWIGSRTVVVTALVGGSVSLVLASLATGIGALAVALLGFGAGFGAMNVAANAQAIELERRYRQSILSSFHAAFSAGGLIGAAGGAIAAGAEVGLPAHFGGLALALIAVALVGARFLLPREACRPHAAPVFVRPSRGLLVLGAAAFFTLLAEGAAADWSAVYLSSSIGATATVAALAYTGFSFAMAASRTVGDRLHTHYGPVQLARGGAVLASGGLAVALVVGSTPAALVGFGAMGAGLGVVVPVLFRAAGSTVGVPVGVGVAAVSTIGWLGFLAGPPAIGVAADAVGLRAALGIVVVAIALVALLAPSASPSRREASLALPFQPRAVLSDLDGVLVDSSAAIERAWTRFAARHQLDPEEVRAASHGRRTVDVVRLVTPHLDAEAEAVRLEHDQVADARHLRALPGARELVESVPADRFAIVTSGSRPVAVARLRAAGLPVPEVLVTADDVDDGKPDPAGYLRAAGLLGVEPADSLVLEDAPAGVAAGVAAGMNVIALLTTSTESELQDADRRVPDLRAVLAALPASG
jgi:HAD superfamily hydrolase (TIGR01509 family)